MSCTTISNCKFRAYELSRLNWLKQQLLAALQKWDENKAVIPEEEVVLGNEVKDTVTDVVEILEQIKGDIYSATKEQLWECFVILLEKIEATQMCIKKLNLPQVKSDLLEATDAGPGVGCTNVVVKYRDAELARILNLDRLNRVHRVRNDSGQNEAERSNASIGEALVDGSTLKWDYYGPLDGVDQNEIEKLSIQDIKQLEEKQCRKMPGKSQKMLLTEYRMNLGQLEILSSHL